MKRQGLCGEICFPNTCIPLILFTLQHHLKQKALRHFFHHHHHHVPERLGVFPVPWSSRWSWSLRLFLGRPMFLRPFGLYCSACFGSLFVPILCTCFKYIYIYIYRDSTLRPYELRRWMGQGAQSRAIRYFNSLYPQNMPLEVLLVPCFEYSETRGHFDTRYVQCYIWTTQVCSTKNKNIPVFTFLL